VAKKTTKPRGGKPGRMLRPKKKVLGESALIPAGRLVEPPTKFTHELRRAQPYYYELGGEAPDGTLAAGTRLNVASRSSDDRSWVVTSQGLRVATETEGLRPLGKTARKPK
jgi:hypothetical protein